MNKNKHRHRHSQIGRTLTEVIAVLSIAGILSIGALKCINTPTQNTMQMKPLTALI